MSEVTSPLPKRRRTDSSSVTISPEQIIQRNATVEHFLGQRSNRWMAGYTAVAEEGSSGDTDANTRIPNRQNGNGSGQSRATSADTRSQLGNMRHRSSSSMETAGVAHANWQAQQRTEGANEGSPALSVSGPTIVEYESPYTSNFFSAPSNGRNSMDTPMSAGHPGLPSPAPSDENTLSPGITGTTNTISLPPKRARQHQHPPVPTLASNSHATGPASHQQHPQASRASSFHGSGTPSHWNVYCPPGPVQQQQQMAAQRQSSSSSSSSAQPPARAMATSPMTQQRSAGTSLYAPEALKVRINSFERFSLAENRTTGVDEGRLSLLRDAAWPQTDWFYLALSQVHALITQQPSALPEAIRSLPPTSWSHLDNLLCANSAVSENLLNWLANFPAPINTILADQSISSSYNTYINAAANFLRELPSKWDGLVAHCRQIQAPPLAQDLSMGLGVGSGVLQTVAWRAVTRMIYNGPNDTHVLDHLEILHRHDQQLCNRRYIRPPAEKAAVYTAFQRVRAAWNQWLKMREEHEARQRSLPPISKTAFPQFNLGYFDADVLAIFQGRAPATSGPSNVPFTPQQARMLQQQQLIAANERRLISGQGQTPNQPRVVSQPPALPNMPQRQPTNGGPLLVQMPAQRHAPSPRLVFPHENDGPRSQPTEPNPTRSALHEAHLRSPVSVPLQLGEEMPQLYRYVCRYALSPVRLDKDMPINSLIFDLTDDVIANIPKTLPSRSPGELPNRILSETSMTFRLRCCAMGPNGFLTESDWVVADTHWPDTMYLEMNGQMLETRRPLHHKKHLPIDLTNIVKLGVNEIRVVINRMSTDKRAFDFAVAVEMVGAVAHSTLIRKMESEQTISAAATKKSIQKALSAAGSGTDDDDIAITSTSMTIKLFDPFSGSKIFSTPVRGAGCPHKDCFDLEIFLSQCKRDKPGFPTVVDCWRCPLCRGDVRPSMLVQDKWLVDVRKTLEEQDKLDTRAIIVEADGSWKPKREEKTGVRSASLEREESGMSAKKAKSNEGTPVPKKVIEIIELD